MTHMMHPRPPPEVLYRNDEHRFSVYRLADIPEGVRCSGWEAPSDCRNLDSLMTCFGRGFFCLFSRRGLQQAPRDAVVAVLDEYAGPLLKPRPPLREVMGGADLAGAADAAVVAIWAVKKAEERKMTYFCSSTPQAVPLHRFSKRPSFSIDVEQVHRDQTSYLGARHGERHVKYAHHRAASPQVLERDSSAWSAHLRFLVKRSEAERRRRELDVGWDPYGDEL